MVDQTAYTTWVDFTQRMQGTHVSQTDWTLFYERYRAFIIERCRQKGWSDMTIDILDELAPLFTEASIQRFEHRGPKTFRGWLWSKIRDAHTKVVRARRLEMKLPIDAEASEYLENLDGEEVDSENEYEEWRRYIIFLAFVEAKEKSTYWQVQAFMAVVINKRKPSELTQHFNLTSTQISENVRAFKNKLFHAVNRLDNEYTNDDLDWDQMYQLAQSCRAKFNQINQDFNRYWELKQCK